MSLNRSGYEHKASEPRQLQKPKAACSVQVVSSQDTTKRNKGRPNRAAKGEKEGRAGPKPPVIFSLKFFIQKLLLTVSYDCKKLP